MMGTTTIVDQAFAATRSRGSVALLGYGSRIVSFVVGVGSLALSTAIFPALSRRAAAQDIAGVRRTADAYARAVIAVALPITLLVVDSSPLLVRFLFEGGEFTSFATGRVTRIQQLYAVQLAPYLVSIIYVRTLTSIGNTRALLWISLANAVVNVALDWLLLEAFGLAGIALATSVVYTVSAVLTCVIAWRTLDTLSLGSS
jgi:putative peptidoglycan lipid II flippase